MTKQLSVALAASLVLSFNWATEAQSHSIPGPLGESCDLVGLWHFNGDLTDSSGNGNNGIGHSELLFVAGTQGEAAEFDGQDDYVEMANNSTLEVGLNDYSIAFWLRTTNTANGRIFSKGSSQCVTGYMMRLDGRNMHLENAFSGQCLANFDSNKIVADGTWHFVAGVVDRHQAARIYVDGVLDSEQVIDTSQYDLTNGRNPNIGRNDVTGDEIFSGAIDELRLYKRALSEETVRRLYEQGRSVGATPVGLNYARIRCSDLRTGQTVEIPNAHILDWDCEQAGLIAQPTDKIEIMITGQAAGGNVPSAQSKARSGSRRGD